MTESRLTHHYPCCGRPVKVAKSHELDGAWQERRSRRHVCADKETRGAVRWRRRVDPADFQED